MNSVRLEGLRKTTTHLTYSAGLTEENRARGLQNMKYEPTSLISHKDLVLVQMPRIFKFS
jgi:hypothetical protein